MARRLIKEVVKTTTHYKGVMKMKAYSIRNGEIFEPEVKEERTNKHRKEKEQECNCNRPYEIELTNEEWRKTCSAEDFAYWLADVCAWAMEEFRCGNTEKANIAYWEKWLKQPRTKE